MKKKIVSTDVCAIFPKRKLLAGILFCVCLSLLHCVAGAIVHCRIPPSFQWCTLMMTGGKDKGKLGALKLGKYKIIIDFFFYSVHFLCARTLSNWTTINCLNATFSVHTHTNTTKRLRSNYSAATAIIQANAHARAAPWTPWFIYILFFFLSSAESISVTTQRKK